MQAAKQPHEDEQIEVDTKSYPIKPIERDTTDPTIEKSVRRMRPAAPRHRATTIDTSSEESSDTDT